MSNELIVAGVMSGTSADGIDVALVRISSRSLRAENSYPTVELLAHESFPFSSALRKAILGAMDAPAIATAELARLNWRLGIAYADAVRASMTRHSIPVDLVGCHGQTLYHQGVAKPYLGKQFSCTWQLGEPAIIAGELIVPVVSNFRPADMVAGGQGAPLVSLLDYAIFRHAKRGRVLQNIGGIANLTAIPGGASMNETLAFDTGPGNMIVDALTLALYDKPMDMGGKIAGRGRILEPVLRKELSRAFFQKEPPKSAGREQFGRAYAEKFLSECRKLSKRNEDAIATATAFTARSIASAYESFVHESMKGSPVDFVASGGGVFNLTLMQELKDRLEPLGCKLGTTDDFGMPAQAKEAAAFALLAWQTWHHRPGNLPAATGAHKPVILGQVTYV